MDQKKINEIEEKMYRNLIHAGQKASAVDAELLNAKLTVEEGLLLGSLIALSQTVAELMKAKGRK